MVRTELGARFDRRVAVGADSFLALKGRAAWAHDATSDASVAAAFQTLPGANFTVNGAAPPKNLALLSLGADWYINQSLSLGVMADGEVSAASRSLAGRATLRYRW
jgi:outer membrane autotransporter protein